MVLLVLAACSDYQVQGKDTAHPGFDTGDSWSPPVTDTETDEPGETAPPEDECPAADLGSTTVTIDDTCETEVTVGSFDPVIKWKNEEMGDSAATPVVGNLTDDNGDGKVDENDIPDIVVGASSGLYWAVSGDDGRTLWTTTNPVGGNPMTAAIADVDGDGWPDVIGGSSTSTAAWYGADGTTIWQVGAYTGSNNASCGAMGVADLDGDGALEAFLGNWILDAATGDTLGTGRAGNGASRSSYAPIGFAADIDQDGTMEVVVGNALYDRDGNSIWENGLADGAVATGQFDGDDAAEIVVARDGGVRLQDDDGSMIWENRGAYGSTIGSPTVADFDGDGEPEIGVAGMDNYFMIDTDGSLIWSRPTLDHSSGYTGSSAFDFEGDGVVEVVYADEESVWVFDGPTGDVKLEQTEHTNATAAEYPVIADVDNDDHADIVYVSYRYHGTETGVRVMADATNSWRPATHAWNQHAYSITNVNDDSSIPRYADANWLRYNNFRSGDLSAGTGSSVGDATLVLTETCTTECDEGDLRLVVVVANAGTSALEPGLVVTLSTWASGTESVVASVVTTEEIAPGSSSSGLEFHVDPALVVDGLVRFAVDPDDAVFECHEDNNVLDVKDGLCP